MSMQTVMGGTVDAEMMSKYLHTLVNRLFKILPIREQEDESFVTYVQSLQMELSGCKNYIEAFHNDSIFLTILSILQYLIDNPDCSVRIVRREVFHAISLCNKLKSIYVEINEAEG